jgi:DNA-directed RNA polymerase specialized sigma24 family protein
MAPGDFVVLATFVVTLLGGLIMRFGIHTSVAALLAIWILVALTLPAAFDASHVSTSAWSQGLAWLIGSAPWIAVALVAWLARRRRAVVSHFPRDPRRYHADLYAQGWTLREISAELGVHSNTVGEQL